MDPKARPLSLGALPYPVPPPTTTYEAALVMILRMSDEERDKLARWFKR